MAELSNSSSYDYIFLLNSSIERLNEIVNSLSNDPFCVFDALELLDQIYYNLIDFVKEVRNK